MSQKNDHGPRLNCVVIGCKRSRKAASYSEWICAKHWGAVDERTVRLFKQARAHAKRLRSRFLRVARRNGQPGAFSGASRLYKIASKAYKRMDRRWKAVILDAQIKQDMGYFNRPARPKGPRVKSKRATIEELLRQKGLPVTRNANHGNKSKSRSL